VVGAVIAVASKFGGLTPMAVLAALVTPELSEICCAYGLIGPEWSLSPSFCGDGRGGLGGRAEDWGVRGGPNGDVGGDVGGVVGPRP